MKHLKHLFTAMLFMCCSIATAHDFVVDGIYYSITDATNNTVEVTYRGDSYSSYSNEYTGSVVIPENITFFGTTYSVTRIGSSAFYGCSGLNNVIIPNSVTSIGDRAFEGCNNLLTIYNLSQISFTIGSTKIINIPNGDILDGYIFLTNNGIHTLYKYVGIETNLILPDSYNGNSFAIGDSVFYDYSGFTSVTIPNSVTSIGDYAFYGCTGLTSITIPNSVASIGRSAFEGCTNLKDLCIEDGEEVLSLVYNEYYEGSFYNCPLENLYLGRNLSYKSNYSPFYDKGILKYVTIGNSVTSIKNGAFEGCTGLKKIDFNCKNIGSWFRNNTSIEEVIIGNGVTSTEKDVFSGCTGIKEVHISDLFAWCGIDFYGSYSNPLFYTKSLYLNGELVTDLVIPDNVTRIKSSAFYGCKGLTSVTIPNSVTSIGSSAFSRCTGLTNVTIPNSVTSIGHYAFSGCTGLKEVHISDLFAWCGIYFSDSYSNPLFYAKNLYLNGELVTDLVIPDNVTRIKSSAFYGCKGLTSVTIPNNVTSIGEDAFSGCTGLTSITIPNSVTSIEDGAFYGCTGLKSITIPNSVTSIERSVFYGCTGLTSVTIPNSVTNIGDYAFSRCSGLTSITIPNSVTSIGDYAFYGCNRIEELYISRSIKSIGSYAFAECNNIFIIRIGSEHLITTYENVFSEDAYINAILYVPIGTKNFYESISPWSNFYILEMDFTDIKDVKCENGIVKGVYDLHGRKIEKPINGIYIINGKKVFIK